MMVRSSAEFQVRRESALPRGVACAFPVCAERAEGAEIWDTEGRRYIDFIGGMGALAVGHSHPQVVEAVSAQLQRFTHTFFGSIPYDGYVRLAERLNAIAPFRSPAKTLLVTTGAEAVENAVKIARFHSGRRGVIVFSGGFHGRTLLTLAMTSQIDPYKRGFGPFPTDVYHAAFPSAYRGPSADEALEALRDLFETQIEPDQVAAMVIEPVQGEAGFLPAPPEFMRGLRALCDAHGIVLIADEVQSGFARTGRVFAIEHSGVEPDLVALGKSFGGGLPIAAVIGKAVIMDAVPPGGLGGTYAGNPLACAAALAALDVLEEENLPARSMEIGKRLTTGFRSLNLRTNCPAIGEVRGLGAMIGIEFVDDAVSRRPATALTANLVKEAAMHGLLLASAGRAHNVIRVLAPLTVSNEIIDEALEIFAESLARVAHLSHV
ncbi:MAG: 4-aminobutyrate--2-oxoglutarate transaminase [Mesorhizobium sp.]|uniref:4-aminobutyrate--2-oxoglutarate transaminase n=1 Tax=Mesorhizobium sp. TaxID=1871066 RepID=UPI000FE2D045|nr:4-aminobutyrate--2-oxoglutarate transaminase [Mesorhizobium sp.]RWJ58247.1 MAG: 4-aminobutyrate--2-oxoglutarate transaminase [Mesorhizobium sp.]TIO72152.1 MAG: 4-aminobutyrate--2-oxoglutarate transaminase [Mesorhizobium sp.]